MLANITPEDLGQCEICYQFFPDPVLELQRFASKFFGLEEAGCRILLAINR